MRFSSKRGYTTLLRSHRAMGSGHGGSDDDDEYGPPPSMHSSGSPYRHYGGERFYASVLPKVEEEESYYAGGGENGSSFASPTTTLKDIQDLPLPVATNSPYQMRQRRNLSYDNMSIGAMGAMSDLPGQQDARPVFKRTNSYDKMDAPNHISIPISQQV